MKRGVAAVVAAVLAVSLASVAGFAQATASPGVRTAAAYTPTLSWNPCGTGTSDECADFLVPLDYANPDGQKITLAVRRHTATAGPYLGVMLANPGGPGASGTGLVTLAGYVPGGVGHQYDWIGWDPRGVGASTPSLHCDSSFFGVNRPNYVPRTHRLMRFWKAKNRRYAARCGASAAAYLLPHMTTMDNAQDMESLRVALGSPAKINYYGFSYGTYLGQAYATAYPDHVGRFVFDGVVDPTNYWYGANLRQEVGFDRNLSVFFKWVAKHRRAYHLGGDWRTIRRGYFALLRKLDLHAAYHRKLGPDELTDAMINAGYYVFNWNYIASAYSKLVRHGRGGPMFALYSDLNMGDDNGYAVYLGVQCSDAFRPPWSKQVTDAWRIHKRHPFLAWDNTWFNAPCLTWSAPSRSRLAISGSAAAGFGGKFLLVNETRDAATPYSGALRVRALFPSSALIAGVGGTTHAGSLSGVSCVDSRIATFLGSGTLPTRLAGNTADVLCPKVPPPSTTVGARLAGQGGLPPSLRALLMRAQRTSLG